MYTLYADPLPKLTHMVVEKSKTISLLRTSGIYFLGLISGIQIALYMYDYYDDGIADYKSLLIGIAMVLLSVGFILYTFRSERSNDRNE